MRTSATILCAALVALSFSSCQLLKGRYERNANARIAYLAEKKTAPAKTNIEGLWYSPEWGIVLFNQEPGGKLQGIFQDYYHVDGVVSGKNIYLALIDDEWTEYTVQLHRDNYDTITGYWSAHIPFSEEDQQPLTLKRIEK